MAFFNKLNRMARSIGEITSEVFESACGTDKISPERNAAEEEFKKIGEHYYKVFAEGDMLITFCIWVAGTGAIRFAIMHYMGYLVKAGHIAVIAEACKRGRIPKNQVAYGKQKVKERFATANIYFAVDKLVTSAVKQIQKNIDKAGDKLDFIPGMNAISGAAKLFVDISLGYIDECCLGWTFYQNQQGAFQSAADGVVIYAQNWKVLLKHAAKTMLKAILILLGIVLAAFVPVGLIFKLLKWSPLAAFLIACLIAWVVKFAVIDSYIMIQMMGTYMEVAPQTRLAFDLYKKPCAISASFKELFQKGRRESSAQDSGMRPRPPAREGAYSAAPRSYSEYDERPRQAPPRRPTPAERPRAAFCSNCGTRNEAGTRFCQNCGEEII